MSSRLRVPVLLSAALLAGCAANQAHVQQPAPCSDSLYVQLKREHPDSLSEREWQRLQSLDQACAATRVQTEAPMSGMMGMGPGHGILWMGVVMVVGAIMVLMMTALR